MRGRALKVLMVVLVLIPVLLTVYLARTLYQRKGVPEALENLTRQLFQTKEEEKKAVKQAEQLAHKAEELETAYNALLSGLKGEVGAKEIQVRQFREKLSINFVDKVLFDSGSAEITPRGKTILKKVADALKTVQDKRIYVVGHTDNVPIHSFLYPSNWELSACRSASVIRFLSESGGLTPDRFTAMGRAFYQPVASNDTPEGRHENRRVEIIVANFPLLEGESGSEAVRGTVEGPSTAPAAPGKPSAPSAPAERDLTSPPAQAPQPEPTVPAAPAELLGTPPVVPAPTAPAAPVQPPQTPPAAPEKPAD